MSLARLASGTPLWVKAGACVLVNQSVLPLCMSERIAQIYYCKHSDKPWHTVASHTLTMSACASIAGQRPRLANADRPCLQPGLVRHQRQIHQLPAVWPTEVRICDYTGCPLVAVNCVPQFRHLVQHHSLRARFASATVCWSFKLQQSCGSDKQTHSTVIVHLCNMLHRTQT